MSTSTADGAGISGTRPAAAQRAAALGGAAGQIETNSEINYGGNSNAIERAYGRRKGNRLDIDRTDSQETGALEYQRDILRADGLSRGSKPSNNSRSAAHLGQPNNLSNGKLGNGGG